MRERIRRDGLPPIFCNNSACGKYGAVGDVAITDNHNVGTNPDVVAYNNLLRRQFRLLTHRNIGSFETMAALLHNEVRTHHDVIADYGVVFDVCVDSKTASRAQPYVTPVAEIGSAFNIYFRTTLCKDMAATPNAHSFP